MESHEVEQAAPGSRMASMQERQEQKDARRLSGRKRHHATDRRTLRIVIRVNAAERAQLEAMAQAQGLSVARLMMRSVFAGSGQNAVALANLRRELVGAKTLLARQGALLNQITRAVNSGDDVPDELAHLLRSMQATTQRIDAAVERSEGVA